MSTRIVLEARVDACALATILRFFNAKGVKITNRSKLVNLSVETLAQLLVANQHVEPFTDQISAIQFLNTTLGSAFVPEAKTAPSIDKLSLDDVVSDALRRLDT